MLLRPACPWTAFRPEVLEELAAAGFVKIDASPVPETIDRVFAGTGTDDFAWRGRDPAADAPSGRRPAR